MSDKKDTTSKTEKETWLEEQIFGLGHHYVTTITDGDKKVEGRGATAEKAQEVASEKWENLNDDDDE